MATTAQKVARVLGNDGQNWETPNGTELWALCERLDARRNVADADKIAYEFADESAIVMCGGGWDIRPNGCKAWCWEGVGCTCQSIQTRYQVIYGLGGTGETYDNLEDAASDYLEATRAARESGDMQEIGIEAIDYPADGSDSWGLSRYLNDDEYERFVELTDK